MQQESHNLIKEKWYVIYLRILYDIQLIFILNLAADIYHYTVDKFLAVAVLPINIHVIIYILL